MSWILLISCLLTPLKSVGSDGRASRFVLSGPHVVVVGIRTLMLQTSLQTNDAITRLGLDNVWPVRGALCMSGGWWVYRLAPHYEITIRFHFDGKKSADVVDTIRISSRSD